VRAGRDHPDGLVGDRLLPVRRGDHLALCLRDHLGRDHDDVAVQQASGAVQRVPDQGGQVVAGAHLTDAVRGHDLQPLRWAVPADAHRCSFGSTSRPKTSIHSRWLRPTLCR